MHGGGTPQSNSLGILVPAYVGKKALNPGRKIECTRARMMRKSPDKQFGIRFLTWNVGYIGKVGEISETLERRCVYICCLQKVRWKGKGAKMIGNGFKFLWSGSRKWCGCNSCQLVNWEDCGSDRVMKINIVIGDVVWEVVSCYCPQSTGWYISK